MLLKKNGLKVAGLSSLAVIAGVTAIAAPQIYAAHSKPQSASASVVPGAPRRVVVKTKDFLAGLSRTPKDVKNHSDKISDARGRELLLRHESKFLENKGQWDRRAKFMARTPGMDMWMDPAGIEFDYYRTKGSFVSRSRQGDVVHLSFAGGKSNISYVSKNDTGSRTDFLIGKTRALNVRAYYDVYANAIYPGIDFHTYFDNLKPRYDMIVHPGSSASQIKLRFSGQQSVSTNKAQDSILLNTSVGQEMETSLTAYQTFGAARKKVQARFVRLDAKTVGVKVGPYDKSRELVIDPLVYGSYYGGDAGFDEVRDVVEDGFGGNYLTGDTQSIYFPAIFGPYGQYNLIGIQNAFLSKLQGDAYNHDYAAFIGGHDVDAGQYLKIDPNGNIWMAGSTASPDFPAGASANTSPVATYYIGVPFTSDANPSAGALVTNGTFQILSANGASTGALQSNVSPAQMAKTLNSTIGAGQGLSSPITVTSMSGGSLQNGGVYRIQIPNGASNPFVYNLSTDCSTEIFGQSVVQEGLNPSFLVTGNGPFVLERLGSTPLSYQIEITVQTTSSTGTVATDTTAPIFIYPTSLVQPTAPTIQAALALLGNVGKGNVTVTGTGVVTTYKNPMTITFGAASGGAVTKVTVAPAPGTILFPQNLRYQVRQSTWKFLLPFSIDSSGTPQPRTSGAFVLDGPNASQESLGFQTSNPENQGNWGWFNPGNNQFSPNYQAVAPGTPAEMFQGFDIRQQLAGDGSVDIVLAGTTTGPLPELSGAASYPGTVAGYMLRYKYTGSPTGGDALTLTPSASTYVGGSHADDAGIALDLAGNAYLTGTVYATENIECGPTSSYFVTGTALNTSTPGPSWQNGTNGDLLKFDDIYVRQYSYSGALAWSGLLGGHTDDTSAGLDMEVDGSIVPTGSCIAIDQENAASNAQPSVYITGISRSYDYPRTRGTFGQQFEDAENVVVTKVSNDGTQLLYSTNLDEGSNFGIPITPHSAVVLPAGIAIDAHGEAFVTGNSHFSLFFPDDLTPPPTTPPTPDEFTGINFPSMPTTPQNAVAPVQPAFSNTWTSPAAPELATSEPWVEVLSFDASTLLFGSYLGGQLDDRVYAPYVDPAGDCWLFGWTESGRQYFVPTTPNPTERQIVGQQLPGAMISPLAFKHYSDSAGDGPQMGPGSATYIDQVAYGLLNQDGYGFGSPWYPFG